MNYVSVVLFWVKINCLGVYTHCDVIDVTVNILKNVYKQYVENDCNKFHIHQVVVFIRWLYSSGGLIHQVVLFVRWSYSSGGRIHQVVVFIRWSYSSGGCIHQVVVFIRLSFM